MGNTQTRTLFYFGAGIALVLLLMIWGTSKESSSASVWGPWSNITSEAEAKESTHLLEASPKAQWKRIAIKKDDPTKNEYQPATSYVNSYTPKTEYLHPLVASTKFISKKDQKKKKLGKKKQALLAQKKALLEKSKREMGLSESEDDDFESDTRQTTGFQGAPQNQNTANNGNPRNKEKEEEQNLNTLEYWEKPIFVDEDSAMVSKLISSFQVKKVSTNIFYDLVTEMRQDERLQIREFGLTALSSTPSPRSFSELAAMKNTDPDAELRTAASRVVANYYQEKNLSYVVSALKTSNEQSTRTAYEALVVLDDATKKYSGLTAQGEGSPAPKTGVSLSRIESQFEQALSVIDANRLTESPDPRVKTQAVQTESSLKGFVSI